MSRRPTRQPGGAGSSAGSPEVSPFDRPEWLPVLVRPAPAARPPTDTVVEWARADQLELREPFFSQTVERLLQQPFNRLLRPRTGLDGLLDFAAAHPGVPLAGIVAHVSRCGSTLVSSWLGASPQRLSLSEPAPLDDVLRLRGLRVEEHVALVRAVVSALAQPRRGQERRAFVKLDAWHTPSLPLLRAAFPTVPVVGLARDPVEVLVSSERQRGAHMVPGALPPEGFGMTWDEVVTLPPADYMARVLSHLLDAMLAADVDLHVDHADLAAARGRVLDLFDVDETAETAALDLVSTRHAKTPERSYADDSADKQRSASPALRTAAERLARPSYEEFSSRARAAGGTPA